LDDASHVANDEIKFVASNIMTDPFITKKSTGVLAAAGKQIGVYRDSGQLWCRATMNSTTSRG